MLGRWGSTVPPDRVHVVTVPPAGRTLASLLWERFATTLGIDPDGVRRRGRGPRQHLARPCRRPSCCAGSTSRSTGGCRCPRTGGSPRTGWPTRCCPRRTARPRLALPPGCARRSPSRPPRSSPPCATRGYDVVGDLDDLLPAGPTAGGDDDLDPDGSTDGEVAAAGVDAVAGLLLELAAERDRAARGAGMPAAGARRPDDDRARQRRHRIRRSPAGPAAPGRRTRSPRLAVTRDRAPSDPRRLEPGVTGRQAARCTVVLHIGAFKTGTSYVQNVLWGGREVAGRARRALPRRRIGWDDQIHAVRERARACVPSGPRQEGAWDRLAGQLAELGGHARRDLDGVPVAGATPRGPRRRRGPRTGRGARRAHGARPGPGGAGLVAGAGQERPHLDLARVRRRHPATRTRTPNRARASGASRTSRRSPPVGRRGGARPGHDSDGAAVRRRPVRAAEPARAGRRPRHVRRSTPTPPGTTPSLGRGRDRGTAPTQCRGRRRGAWTRPGRCWSSGGWPAKDGGPPTRPLRLTAEDMAWISRCSTQVATELADGGWRVVGDLADLEPRSPTGGRRPTRRGRRVRGRAGTGAGRRRALPPRLRQPGPRTADAGRGRG